MGKVVDKFLKGLPYYDTVKSVKAIIKSAGSAGQEKGIDNYTPPSPTDKKSEDIQLEQSIQEAADILLGKAVPPKIEIDWEAIKTRLDLKVQEFKTDVLARRVYQNLRDLEEVQLRESDKPIAEKVLEIKKYLTGEKEDEREELIEELANRLLGGIFPKVDYEGLSDREKKLNLFYIGDKYAELIEQTRTEIENLEWRREHLRQAASVLRSRPAISAKYDEGWGEVRASRIETFELTDTENKLSNARIRLASLENAQLAIRDIRYAFLDGLEDEQVKELVKTNGHLEDNPTCHINELKGDVSASLALDDDAQGRYETAAAKCRNPVNRQRNNIKTISIAVPKIKDDIERFALIDGAIADVRKEIDSYLVKTSLTGNYPLRPPDFIQPFPIMEEPDKKNFLNVDLDIPTSEAEKIEWFAKLSELKPQLLSIEAHLACIKSSDPNDTHCEAVREDLKRHVDFRLTYGTPITPKESVSIWATAKSTNHPYAAKAAKASYEHDKGAVVANYNGLAEDSPLYEEVYRDVVDNNRLTENERQNVDNTFAAYTVNTHFELFQSSGLTPIGLTEWWKNAYERFGDNKAIVEIADNFRKALPHLFDKSGKLLALNEMPDAPDANQAEWLEQSLHLAPGGFWESVGIGIGTESTFAAGGMAAGTLCGPAAPICVPAFGAVGAGAGYIIGDEIVYARHAGDIEPFIDSARITGVNFSRVEKNEAYGLRNVHYSMKTLGIAASMAFGPQTGKFGGSVLKAGGRFAKQLLRPATWRWVGKSLILEESKQIGRFIGQGWKFTKGFFGAGRELTDDSLKIISEVWDEQAAVREAFKRVTGEDLGKQGASAVTRRLRGPNALKLHQALEAARAYGTSVLDKTGNVLPDAVKKAEAETVAVVIQRQVGFDIRKLPWLAEKAKELKAGSDKAVLRAAKRETNVDICQLSQLAQKAASGSKRASKKLNKMLSKVDDEGLRESLRSAFERGIVTSQELIDRIGVLSSIRERAIKTAETALQEVEAELKTLHPDTRTAMVRGMKGTAETPDRILQIFFEETPGQAKKRLWRSIAAAKRFGLPSLDKEGLIRSGAVFNRIKSEGDRLMSEAMEHLAPFQREAIERVTHFRTVFDDVMKRAFAEDVVHAKDVLTKGGEVAAKTGNGGPVMRFLRRVSEAKEAAFGLLNRPLDSLENLLAKLKPRVRKGAHLAKRVNSAEHSLSSLTTAKGMNRAAALRDPKFVAKPVGIDISKVPSPDVRPGPFKGLAIMTGNKFKLGTDWLGKNVFTPELAKLERYAMGGFLADYLFLDNDYEFDLWNFSVDHWWGFFSGVAATSHLAELMQLNKTFGSNYAATVKALTFGTFMYQAGMRGNDEVNWNSLWGSHIEYLLMTPAKKFLSSGLNFSTKITLGRGLSGLPFVRRFPSMTSFSKSFRPMLSEHAKFKIMRSMGQRGSLEMSGRVMQAVRRSTNLLMQWDKPHYFGLGGKGLSLLYTGVIFGWGTGKIFADEKLIDADPYYKVQRAAKMVIWGAFGEPIQLKLGYLSNMGQVIGRTLGFGLDAGLYYFFPVYLETGKNQPELKRNLDRITEKPDNREAMEEAWESCVEHNSSRDIGGLYGRILEFGEDDDSVTPTGINWSKITRLRLEKRMEWRPIDKQNLPRFEGELTEDEKIRLKHNKIGEDDIIAWTDENIEAWARLYEHQLIKKDAGWHESTAHKKAMIQFGMIFKMYAKQYESDPKKHVRFKPFYEMVDNSPFTEYWRSIPTPFNKGTLKTLYVAVDEGEIDYNAFLSLVRAKKIKKSHPLPQHNDALMKFHHSKVDITPESK